MLIKIAKNDIITGAVIIPDYWLRIINALDGTDTADLVINGQVHIENGKLYLNDVSMVCTADELNTLHNRTPGIVEELKPIIPDAEKAVDNLYIKILRVDTLINTNPSGGAAVTGGTVFAYQNFK